MDRLRLITSFIQAVEAGNFSKAARALKTSPQIVSSHILQLETWLETRLFNRTTRQVTLTQEGKIFYEKCTLGLQLIEQGEHALRDRKNEATGTVRLAVGHTLGSTMMAPLLMRFSELYPQIHVELLVLNQVPDMVKHGIDIGVIGGDLPVSGLVARKIGSVRHFLCASPAYLKKYGTPQVPADLLHHRCIALKHPREDRVRPWSFQIDNQIRTFELDHIMTVGDTSAQRWLVLNGAGLGQVTNYFAEPYLQSGELVNVDLGYVSRPLDLHIYMPNRDRLPQRCRLLVDFLFNELRERVAASQ